VALTAVGVARAQPRREPAPVDPARRSEEYVIPSGAEPLLADMLGSGVTLPGGCTFGDGQVARTSVRATYACGSEQVVLELLHPSVAPASGVRTERFAVTVKSGTPPRELVKAVADRVRAREAGFQWTVPPDVERSSGTSAPGRGASKTTLLFAVAALAIVAFWRLRRGSARRSKAD
jgi:hypothetical protein